MESWPLRKPANQTNREKKHWKQGTKFKIWLPIELYSKPDHQVNFKNQQRNFSFQLILVFFLFLHHSSVFGMFLLFVFTIQLSFIVQVIITLLHTTYHAWYCLYHKWRMPRTYGSQNMLIKEFLQNLLKSSKRLWALIGLFFLVEPML